MQIAEHPRWKQANDTLKKLNRREATVEQEYWPTQENLAEAQENGCVLCDAPSGSLYAIKKFSGHVYGTIEPDGTISWGDYNPSEDYLYQIVCSECGEGVWEKT